MKWPGRFYFLLLILITAGLLLGLTSLCRVWSQEKTSPPEKAESMSRPLELLVVFHFDFIMCPLCAQTLNEFIKIINSNKLNWLITGIVIVDPEEIRPGRSLAFIKKQIEGFAVGNYIQFPIYTDTRGKFLFTADSSPLVIVFDQLDKELRYYSLTKDMREIKDILLKHKGD